MRKKVQPTESGPTPAQLLAVLEFAHKYRNKRGGWKEHLVDCWINGADARETDGHLLRQVRNQFGPRWLATFTG